MSEKVNFICPHCNNNIARWYNQRTETDGIVICLNCGHQWEIKESITSETEIMTNLTNEQIVLLLKLLSPDTTISEFLEKIRQIEVLFEQLMITIATPLLEITKVIIEHINAFAGINIINETMFFHGGGIISESFSNLIVRQCSERQRSEGTILPTSSIEEMRQLADEAIDEISEGTGIPRLQLVGPRAEILNNDVIDAMGSLMADIDLVNPFGESKENKHDKEFPHHCFKCKTKLQFTHALNQAVRQGFRKKHFKRLWKDKIIQFYCCKCYNKKKQEEELLKQVQIFGDFKSLCDFTNYHKKLRDELLNENNQN